MHMAATWLYLPNLDFFVAITLQQLFFALLHNYTNIYEFQSMLSFVGNRSYVIMPILSVFPPKFSLPKQNFCSKHGLPQSVSVFISHKIPGSFYSLSQYYSPEDIVHRINTQDYILYSGQAMWRLCGTAKRGSQIFLSRISHGSHRLDSGFIFK